MSGPAVGSTVRSVVVAASPSMNRSSPRVITVLLFSPLKGRDPLSGDTSYTESLLADPPPGVRYLDYDEALQTGLMRVRGTRRAVSRWTPVDLVVAAVRLVELALRRAGLMYREPTWFVTIDGDVDLVHQHLFSVRQIGPRVPVVSSAGLPLEVLYEARDGWSRRRARCATACERVFAAAVDAHVPWLRATTGSVMTVYSEQLAAYLRAAGVTVPIKFAGTAIDDAPDCRDRPNSPPTLAFVGRDFELKGGDVAVEAFRLAQREQPNLRLLIATAARNKHLIPTVPGVQCWFDAPRETVVREVLSQADVLLAPTRLDCGAPYGVLEALRAGVVVVMTPLPWLDRRLAPPAVSFAARAPEAIAHAASVALGRPDDDRRTAARSTYRTYFSTSALHRDLLAAYAEITSDPRPRSVA